MRTQIKVWMFATLILFFLVALFLLLWLLFGQDAPGGTWSFMRDKPTLHGEHSLPLAERPRTFQIIPGDDAGEEATGEDAKQVPHADEEQRAAPTGRAERRLYAAAVWPGRSAGALGAAARRGQYAPSLNDRRSKCALRRRPTLPCAL